MNEDDLVLLEQAASRALRAALADGSAKYSPGDWKKRSPGEHINHAVRHLHSINMPMVGDDEDHETHLICRAVMLFAVRGR